MFDLRHLEHSTIMFEEPSHAPLLRLECNKQDCNYIATFVQDSAEVCFTQFTFFNEQLYDMISMLVTTDIIYQYVAAIYLIYSNIVGLANLLHIHKSECIRRYISIVLASKQ